MSLDFPEKDLSPDEQRLAIKFADKLSASRLAGKYTPEHLMPAQEAADWFTENVGTVVKDGVKTVERKFTIRDIGGWVSWLRATRGDLIISSRSTTNPGYGYGVNRREMEHTLSMLAATRKRIEDVELKMLQKLDELESNFKRRSQVDLFSGASHPAIQDGSEIHPVISAIQNELGAEKIEPR